MNDHEPKAFAAITLTAVLWGFSFIGTKLALETLPVFGYIFLRFFIASVLFSLLLIRRRLPRLNRPTALKMVFLALLQPFGYFIFETLGLKHTSATKASLLIALIPIVVAVASRIILKERTGKKGVAGIILSILGVLFLVAGGTESSITFSGGVKGDLFILAAVFAGAFYMVVTRDLTRTLSSFDITVIQVFLGTLFFLPLFLIDLPNIHWQTISTRSLIGVFYNVLGGTLGGFFCYNYGLSRIKASTVSIFINAIPIVTALGAWFILGESLTALQLTGGGIVLASVFLTTSKRRISQFS